MNPSELHSIEALNQTNASGIVTFQKQGEDMAALEPEALLDDFADLPEVIERLIGKAA